MKNIKFKFKFKVEVEVVLEVEVENVIGPNFYVMNESKMSAS